VNTAHIEIRKIPPMSPMPPVKQNDEGNHSKTVGDILSTGDMMPPADKMPPVQTTENQAQKSQIGDTGGIGGILHTHIEGQQRKAANAEAGNESNNSLPSYSGDSNSIYRLGHSDTFACHNCKQKGDKWFMQKHVCTGGNGKLSL
jgi:hypothetical protein